MPRGEMAKTRKPPIPASLFKHFAMATIALTAAVAMLADGSHREAKIEAPEVVAEAARSTVDNVNEIKREYARAKSDALAGDYYSESADSFGQPMMRPARSGGSINPVQASQGGRRPAVAGYSQDYLDSLTDAEYEALVDGLREAGMLDPDQRAVQLASLERSSAGRSGRATRD